MKIVEKLKSLDKKTVLLGVLIVGVLAMTVAFAALSTSLNIFGTANVAATKWNIRFESWVKTNPETVDGHNNTAVSPAVDSLTKQDGTNITKVSGINVQLSQPGDTVRYTFKIANRGTINAKLNNFTKTIEPSNDVISYQITCLDENEQDALDTNFVLGVEKTIDCTLEVKYKDQTNAQTPGVSQVYEQSAINTTLSAQWTWVQDSSTPSPSPSPSDQGQFIDNTGWKLLNPGASLLSQQWEYWENGQTKIQSGWHELTDLSNALQDYYFENGLVQMGWKTQGGHTYYLSTFDEDNNGYVDCNMLKNVSKEIDGQCWAFDSNGYATQSNTCASYVYYYHDMSTYEDTSTSTEPNVMAYLKENQSNHALQSCVDFAGTGNHYCVNSTWDCGSGGGESCAQNSYIMSVKNYVEATYDNVSCRLVGDEDDSLFSCEDEYERGFSIYYTKNNNEDYIRMEIVGDYYGCSMPVGDPNSFYCSY